MHWNAESANQWGKGVWLYIAAVFHTDFDYVYGAESCWAATDWLFHTSWDGGLHKFNSTDVEGGYNA